jgi:proline dehydrogenase
MSIARKALLAMSTNAWLRERATKTAFVRRSVSTFMPGERLEDALAAAAAQQARGIDTILTKLGENVTSMTEAEAVTVHYLDVLDKVQGAGLNAQISVKPTQLGLDLDKELCFKNLLRLIERADARNNLVWIDMESSPYVDPTLDLFRRARAVSPRVGIALQAYLYRTAADVESLVPLGAAIRLVKGAYLEPPSWRTRRKRTSTRTSTRWRAGCSPTMRGVRGACCTSPRTIRNWPIASPRSSTGIRCRGRRTRTRCCTAFSGRFNNAWSPPAARCAC